MDNWKQLGISEMAKRDWMRQRRTALPAYNAYKALECHKYNPRDLQGGPGHARGLEDILIISGSQLPSGWPPIMRRYGLNCVPPHKSHMFKPYPLSAVPQKVTAFGNRAYKDVLTKMGPLQCVLIQSHWCPYKRRLRYTEGWPHEEAARWWSSTSQGERCQRKSTLQTLRPWTFSLQNCEKINFCCLGYPICGILLYSSLTRPIFILYALSTFPVLNHHFF